MKKIFIISLFIGFIAVFLSSSFEAKATCPQGYTEVTINMTYYTHDPYPNGSPVSYNFTLTFCYQCSMTGVGFDLFIDKFHNFNGCPINVDFWEQAHSAIADYMVNNSGCVAPCSWEGWTQHDYTIKQVTCWKHVHKAGDPATEYDVVPCDGSAECNYIYKICYDPGPPSSINRILSDKFLTGTIDCQYSQEIMVPPQGVDPIQDDWETDCFVLDTGCE